MKTEHDGTQHHQRLATVGRQDKKNRLADIVIDGPAFLDRMDDRGKIVIHQHHLGGFLCHFRPIAPHGHTHVGPLQRRCVVDPVTGHCHHIPQLLQGVDQSQLMFGGDPGIDIHLPHNFEQSRFIHVFEILACYHLLSIEQAYLISNCGGGHRMVSGNHLDSDTCLLTGVHGCHRF